MKSVFSLFLVLFLFLACAEKVRKPKAEKPPAFRSLYEDGLSLLEKGDIEEAKKVFNKITAIRSDVAEGYAGLALSEAEEKNFDNAMNYARRAIEKEPASVAALFAMARIMTLSHEDLAGLQKAVQLFDRAIDLAPRNDRLHYYKGLTLKKAQDYEKAIHAFIKALAIEGPYAKRAEIELHTLRHVERLKPDSKQSWKIGLKEAIARGDLAYFLVEELDLPGLIKKYRPDDRSAIGKTGSLVITDIADHPAKEKIYLLVRLDIMDVYPDQTFKADKALTRAHFAVTLQRLLVYLSRDESIQTRYSGTSSTISDVPSTHYAYNAVRVMIDLDIMQTSDDAFHPSETISGMTALAAMNEISSVVERI
jgi:tetratricopeptide (TPR) repeat protein